MTEWELVYADGTRYTDADGPWRDAPDGVQILVTHTPEGRNLTYGESTYALDGRHAPKKGDWMPESKFYELVDEVLRG